MRQTYRVLWKHLFITGWILSIWLGLAFTPTRAIALDDMPPNTALVEMPALISPVPEASFTLQGSDDLTPGAALTFECRMDGSIWTVCPASPTYPGLDDGEHTFAARAIDAAGNCDSTPATYTWTIDTTPPETYVSVPTVQEAGSRASVLIGLLGEDALSDMVQFNCRLGQTGWLPCSNPVLYADLGTGFYRFEVYAVDQAGNPDPSPANLTWAVPWKMYIPLVGLGQ